MDAPGMISKLTYNVGLDGENGDLVAAGTLSLKGTEVHCKKWTTNQHICVRYVFSNSITQRFNPQDKPWEFFFNRVVVEPGVRYRVSVSNLPKQNGGSYFSNRTVTVPRCKRPEIQRCKVCLENGSLWEPNLTYKVYTTHGVLLIGVDFNTGEFSESYIVSLQSPDLYPYPNLPRHTCKLTLSLAGASTLLLVATAFRCFCKRNSAEDAHSKSCSFGADEMKCIIPVPERRRVLIIYSLDHPLYKEIILKLCAFLRSKCGAEVILDLLDSAWLSTIGCIQWLDLQRELISRSSDKILILCSRGVYAKWRAMCGEDRVILREDLRSPMGDMFSPALSLIIPDFVKSTSFQRYMVAYFEDVCCEEDVPAPFNVTVKYRLMKHFEELLFRLLDWEKQEPGRVNRIEGVGVDNYFTCPSGKALQDAIETFHAFQLENPNWFEMELVDCPEEVLEETKHGKFCFADLAYEPVLQCNLQYEDWTAPVLINTTLHPDEQLEQSLMSHIPDFSVNDLHTVLHIDLALASHNAIHEHKRGVPGKLPTKDSGIHQSFPHENQLIIH
ncbi:LOW QUALITY PROTEIN: interleukin-17 receptor A [Chanos chanos]|uniref:LOW QUALITY PROTEIN: interleukin-17 receptor A n=1 Tax=Chanos chanos TaxID=29144 RepID=A0A6J2UPC9_CHACN|nr:LOW QUALITY PROTEIN: interleukin-17 receptor A-like [Chanos chanos]